MLRSHYQATFHSSHPASPRVRADRRTVEEALNEAREALKGEDAERIRRAQDNLTKASHALAEAMYRQGNGDTTAGAQPSGEPKGPEVVDAEFEDADKGKS